MNIRNFWIFFSLLILQTIQLFSSEQLSVALTNQFPRNPGIWQEIANSVKSNTPSLGFLVELTNPKSQRESWRGGIIAEPIATITNAGLFMAAYKHKDTAPTASKALLVAGVASALSHAIPYNILNIFDKIGAVVSVLSVIKDAQLYKSKKLKKALYDKRAVAILSLTAGIAALDLYVNSGGIERQDYHKRIHGAWHILAALLADRFLTLNRSEIT